jgi:ABC-2 type transport system permease protein
MRFKKTIKGLYAMWYREFKVFQREKSRVISSIFLPLLWFFIFGGSMGSITTMGESYKYFIFPGFLVMTIIFASMFNGAYIVWDKKVDFLKEVLIAPHSRAVVFFGKTLGGMTDCLLQTYILMFVGIFLKVPYTPISFLLSMFILFALAIGLVGMGLILGSFMESPEGFGLVSSLVVYPLFLFSGALYPLDKLPAWLKIITHIDPATYAVDGLRNVILGSSTHSFLFNLAVIACFDVVFIITGTWAFKRMKL